MTIKDEDLAPTKIRMSKATYERNKARQKTPEYKAISKICQKRVQDRFKIWIRELKSNPCTECGEVFPWECMDFDHVRGEKKFRISTGSGRKRSIVEEELAKCELVCVNCHRIRTFKIRPQAVHTIKSTTRNERIIQEAKNIPCMDCGKKFPTICMDFDHVRGIKVRHVSTFRTGTEKSLMAEIDKCDIVCANCHRMRTQSRFPKNKADKN
jgi:hypothetical protein